MIFILLESMQLRPVTLTVCQRCLVGINVYNYFEWYPACVSIYNQTFEGNMNSDGVVRHELQHAILARYIRLIPWDWNSEGRIGLRLELYGCSYCEQEITREENINLPSNHLYFVIEYVLSGRQGWCMCVCVCVCVCV